MFDNYETNTVIPHIKDVTLRIKSRVTRGNGLRQFWKQSDHNQQRAVEHILKQLQCKNSKNTYTQTHKRKTVFCSSSFPLESWQLCIYLIFVLFNKDDRYPPKNY